VKILLGNGRLGIAAQFLDVAAEVALELLIADAEREIRPAALARKYTRSTRFQSAEVESVAAVQFDVQPWSTTSPKSTILMSC